MARGFSTTEGAATTDKIVTALTAHATLRSYAIWFNRNGSGGNNLGRFWEKASTVELLHYDIPTYRYQRAWSGGTGQWTVPQASPATGAWHHLVLTYDAGSTSNDPVIYIDGVSVTVTRTSGPSGTVTTNANPYTLGNRDTDNARVWDGDLAEFAVWDALLTADEAAALGKGISPLLIRPASLVEYDQMLRDNVSMKGTAPTITGTAVQPHPRLILPRSTRRMFAVSASGPASHDLTGSAGITIGGSATLTPGAATHALTGSAGITIGGTATLTTSPAVGDYALETWHQHAGNAHRTGASSITPSQPWRYLWSDGPDSDGGSTSFTGPVPREAFPICGGTRLLAPKGARGVWAYTLATGAVDWQIQYDEFVAAGAYDATTDCFIIGAMSGSLWKIPAAGTISGIRQFHCGSPIRKAVALVGRYAYVSCEDGSLQKIDIGVLAATTPTRTWRYSGGSSAGYTAETPPAYATTAGKLVYATADGYVHAVVDSAGAASWRVAPHSVTWGWPNTWEWAWPVVADVHGVVLLRCQLTGEANGAPHQAGPVGGNAWPNDTAANAGDTIRSWFGTRSSPGTGGAYRNLFALSLTDGAEAFVPAVGYGSMEWHRNNASYALMGTQPVVAVKAGDEIAYMPFRNMANGSPDYRWAANVGEMMLDGTTVSGLEAGDLRFVRMGNAFSGGTGYAKIVDEEAPYTIAGDAIFHAHWAGIEGVLLTDRGDTKGLTFADPITTTDLPTIIHGKTAAGTKNSASRYSSDSGAAMQSRSYETPVYWIWWGITSAPPPGTPAVSAWSAGLAPRIVFVHKQYLLVVGQGGDITAFRHSGTVSGVSAPAAPTALTMTGPTSGSVGAVSDLFTVAFDGDSIKPSGSVVVTLSDGGGGGTFKNEGGTTITTLTLTQTIPAAKFTYTAVDADAVTISITNNGSLTNPSSIAYTPGGVVIIVEGGGGDNDDDDDSSGGINFGRDYPSPNFGRDLGGTNFGRGL